MTNFFSKKVLFIEITVPCSVLFFLRPCQKIKCSFFFLLYILFFSVEAFSQYEGIKINKRLLLKEANEKLERGDYSEALKDYYSLYSVDSISGLLNFKIGVCVYSLGGNDIAATPYFKKAVDDGYKEALFWYGKCLHLQMKFDEALENYKLFKNSPNASESQLLETDRYIRFSETAKTITQDTVTTFIEPLGPPINSNYPEYVPLIAADQSFLIFTSQRPLKEEEERLTNGKYSEDVFISFLKDGKYGVPERMEYGINTLGNDAGAGISADGNTLIIFRSDSGSKNGNLFKTLRQGNGWTKPEILSAEINSPFLETSACPGADGSVLYFSSNRPGGFGGLDIYKTILMGNGEWSLPLNLGPEINTIYDDDSPFIHPDGKTLYFSSKGHLNMGGFDVFSSQLSEKNSWSEAVNLGYPLNSVNNDMFFILSADGKTGFYSTDRGQGTGQDIYKMRLTGQEKKLIIIKGKVMEDDSLGLPLASTITLLNEDFRNTTGIFHSNSASGKFLIAAEAGKKYFLLVNASSEYDFFTGQIDLSGNEIQGEIYREIKVKKTKK